MSALTEKIIYDHPYSEFSEGCAICDSDDYLHYGEHIADLTEAAVREQIAAQIVEQFPESGPLINMTVYREGLIDGMNRAARIVAKGTP